MKKIFGIFLTFMLVTTIFTGCSQQKSITNEVTNTSEEKKVEEAAEKKNEEVKKEPSKIVFLTNETPLLTKDFWQVVSEKFMKQHPEIVVENIAQPSSNVLLVDYLKTLLATGNFPDVTVMAYASEFVSANALMPFEDADLSYLTNPEIGKINGKSYVAPYKIQVEGIFYNKKIFADNGLVEPTNYKEFIEICEKLSAKNITPVSMGIKDGWPQMVLASNLLSLEILANNPNWGIDRNNDKVKFNSPEVKKAMEKFQIIIKKYSSKNATSVTYSQMLEIFFKGKAAMIPMGSWLLGEVTRVKPDFEVGFFPVPNDTDTNVLPIMQQEGLSIGSKTKYPEQCKEFIKFFMTDKEWYGQFLKTEELFPTTKEYVTFDMSPLRKEIGEKFVNMKKVEVFETMSGDNSMLPGLTGYYTKMTNSIAAGTNIDKELGLFDKEWEKVKANLNNK